MMRSLVHRVRQVASAGLLVAAAMPCAMAASPEGICPSPGAPGDVRLTWVAPEVGIDGLPMAIVSLRSPRPPGTILDWYVRHWSTFNRQARPIRYPSGVWQVVARRVAGCIESVQAQAAAGGGTLAYVGISRMGGVVTGSALGPTVPRPAGARTLMTMESQDGARHGTTRLLGVPMGVAAARDYYRQALIQAGWALQMDHLTSPSQAALMAQRHARRLEVALSAVQGKTYVLVTLVKN